MNGQQETHHAIVLLSILWTKFKSQPIYFQAPTLIVLLITLLWILVFYTSFVIWQIFTFIMSRVFLGFVEWYIRQNSKPPSNPHA